MTQSRYPTRGPRPGALARLPAILAAAVALVACAGPSAIPTPRPLVTTNGARLATDRDRLTEINDWVTPQWDNIMYDPTFFIAPVAVQDDHYPWETLVILPGDTARYQFQRANPDLDYVYSIYAHFHLMEDMGRLERWLPEAADAEGYEVERAIVKRTADAWLLGRAASGFQPYGLMDQLVYASEGGYLDAFLFSVRPEEFPEARSAWVEEHPGELEAYREWVRRTFGPDPPRGDYSATGPDTSQRSEIRGSSPSSVP